MPSPSVEHMMSGGFNPHSTKKYPNRRQAAGMSAVGGGLSYVPYVGKIIGAPFMIPDALYDAYDLWNERNQGLKRSLANAGHLILDFPSWLPHIKGDDALEIGGIIDDGVYSATGKQVEEHLKRSLKRNGKKVR